MTANEVLIIQKLDELRKLSSIEGERKGLWANGRGYQSEADAYSKARREAEEAYKELVQLMVTPE